MQLIRYRLSNAELLDNFYRIFFILILVSLLIGVPFVFYRKTVIAILCVVSIAVVTAAWRISRKGQPVLSLKIFASFLWFTLVGLIFFGMPPIIVMGAMAVAIMLCIVVSIRSGILYAIMYMLAWLAYVALAEWDLVPQPYFFSSPFVSWFIAAFAVWLMLLPVPSLVHNMRKAISLQRATLDATTEGILVIASDGKVETYNQKMVEMWRISPEVLKSARDESLLEAVIDQLEDPEQFLAKVRELYGHPEMASLDILRLKDGRIYERTSLPQRLDNRIVGRVWGFRDITETKKIEDALRQSRQLLNSVVENIPAMVFVKKAEDLRFEMFNKAGELLLGYSRNDLLGKNDYDFFPKDQADAFTAEDRTVLDSEEIREVLLEAITTAKGEIRYLYTRKIALRNDAGEPSHLLGISLDITDRKMASGFIKQTDMPQPDSSDTPGDTEQISPLTPVQMGRAPYLRWITATVGNSLRLISVDEVIFFQTDQKYTRVVLVDSEVLIKKSLKDLLGELDPEQFWKIHRSIVVNALEVASIAPNMGGELSVKMKRRRELLPVSESFVRKLRHM